MWQRERDWHMNRTKDQTMNMSKASNLERLSQTRMPTHTEETSGDKTRCIHITITGQYIDVNARKINRKPEVQTRADNLSARHTRSTTGKEQYEGRKTEMQGSGRGRYRGQCRGLGRGIVNNQYPHNIYF